MCPPLRWLGCRLRCRPGCHSCCSSSGTPALGSARSRMSGTPARCESCCTACAAINRGRSCAGVVQRVQRLHTCTQYDLVLARLPLDGRTTGNGGVAIPGSAFARRQAALRSKVFSAATHCSCRGDWFRPQCHAHRIRPALHLETNQPSDALRRILVLRRGCAAVVAVNHRRRRATPRSAAEVRSVARPG